MTNTTKVALPDVEQIKTMLPHRYPFLLVDKVIEFTPPNFLVGVKNVTYNEPFFQGHFPDKAIMPGVLIIEALAQVTGLLALMSADSAPDSGSIYYLVGVDKARFRRPVFPGDQLHLAATLLREIRGMYTFTAEATVDGVLVANANLMTTRTVSNR
jgi:3-hydroxyacyl-[acyl-carrier-protein] dehydratase